MSSSHILTRMQRCGFLVSHLPETLPRGRPRTEMFRGILIQPLHQIPTLRYRRAQIAETPQSDKSRQVESHGSKFRCPTGGTTRVLPSRVQLPSTKHRPSGRWWRLQHLQRMPIHLLLLMRWRSWPDLPLSLTAMVCPQLRKCFRANFLEKLVHVSLVQEARGAVHRRLQLRWSKSLFLTRRSQIPMPRISLCQASVHRHTAHRQQA
mmetsp:Transcript_68361/g.120689  ORF Transcript_68361/g.120689 Transcript_68361/m.120689 type:complete len:207 (-) Transcript_68361:908-1528(-)